MSGSDGVVWRIGKRSVRAAAGSVTGDRYDRNYDVLHLDPDRPLAIVADGMGAGEGSAAAGRIAVDTFARECGGPSPSALRAAVAQVHSAVRRKARTLHDLTGCTLTALIGVPPDGPGRSAALDGSRASGRGPVPPADVRADPPAPEPAEVPADLPESEPAVRIVQLGDSRAYRLRGGLLELLTVDHTIAWLGLIHGWYAATDPRAHADGYRLTRYAGHPDEPPPDVLDVPLHPGDRLLLCTDGVSGQLDYESLTGLLAAGSPTAAVNALLEATLSAGGQDNATAIVLTVT
ncbi:PP2C family serine/threonine-protein phosphatase [Actinoplanes sp. L3-i22]|uniref:PP2C family protein-serine/threonine phosphatase n=1 Tax=Actinoplanes sp. L3-i22 TaxID=2836373 RepID=UPI001C76F2FA|nr:SpoIIE family protein phosphatase [Actinoplanes sp. L3-i22]BCY12562.1 protein phosphatase [Actinoplanes sp. L3-i22]